VAWWYDSLAPRDAVVIDPVFNIAQPLGGTDDPQQLCDDLATAWSGLTSHASQVRVRAYALPYVRGTGHVGEAIQNVGLAPPSTKPRELAVCLSFYADKNKPRQRGRLYMPVELLPGAATSNRPTTAQMSACFDPMTAFTALGGINVDWSVYSVRDDQHRPITNAWVDNEWDVIRSRGLQGTSRQLRTTSEADIPNIVRLQAATDEVAA
jgi:hypothetical protein